MNWIKSYQEFMITIGVIVLIALMFYVKIVKGTKGERVLKRIIRFIRRKKKAKKNDNVTPDSEIGAILNAIGEHYEIIDYSVSVRKGTIKITLKRKVK